MPAVWGQEMVRQAGDPFPCHVSLRNMLSTPQGVRRGLVFFPNFEPWVQMAGCL